MMKGPFLKYEFDIRNLIYIWARFTPGDTTITIDFELVSREIAKLMRAAYNEGFEAGRKITEIK